MTAHDVSKMNHAWLQADKLCAVIDRAYSTAERLSLLGFHPGNECQRVRAGLRGDLPTAG